MAQVLRCGANSGGEECQSMTKLLKPGVRQPLKNCADSSNTRADNYFSRYLATSFRAGASFVFSSIGICRTMGEPSSICSMAKSENSAAASWFNVSSIKALTMRISSSPGIPPRIARKCRIARALAVKKILVSVALGSTLRAAVRTAR